MGGWLTWNERDVSQSFMTMTVTYGYQWWGGWMYHIVTGVTSDVGVPSTYLVIHENAFEIVVCDLASILSRPQFVKVMACYLCQIIIWSNDDLLSVEPWAHFKSPLEKVHCIWTCRLRHRGRFISVPVFESPTRNQPTQHITDHEQGP